jgi:VanZ family protein
MSKSGACEKQRRDLLTEALQFVFDLDALYTLYCSNMKFFLMKLPAVIIILILWILSSQSILPQPKGIFGIDKIQHLLAYMTLACMIGLWPSRGCWKNRPLMTTLIVTGAAAAYGILDEIHQSFVPGRDCNVWDWAADTIGAALGAGAVLAVNRMRFANEA